MRMLPLRPRERDDKHMLTDSPYRSWCTRSARGKSKAKHMHVFLPRVSMESQLSHPTVCS